MFGHRRRRWPNIKPALASRVLIYGNLRFSSAMYIEREVSPYSVVREMSAQLCAQARQQQHLCLTFENLSCSSFSEHTAYH